MFSNFLKRTVHHFTPTDATAVVQGDPSGTSERVADAILDGHVCTF
jgi:hypothetical protein